MTTPSRDQVREIYSRSGRDYDRVRLEDPRGLLLSEYDVALFHEMLPQPLPDWNVLEVGAGTGRFTMPALDRGYRLIATDINETMLDELRAKVEKNQRSDRCEVRLGDIFNLGFPDSHFDLVFSYHVIPRFNTLEDQRAAILEIARTIKPGGRLLFNYRNRRSALYGRIHRGHATTPEQIDSILAEGKMRVVNSRGKWVLNRKLLNRLPLFVGRLAARIDRGLLDCKPHRAWDVFVEAKKDAA